MKHTEEIALVIKSVPSIAKSDLSPGEGPVGLSRGWSRPYPGGS